MAAADPVFEKGLILYRLMQAEPGGGRSYWAGKLMELALEHPRLKLPLFRFIDVLPSLRDSRQVERHFREYFLDGGVPFAGLPAALLGGAAVAVPGALMVGLIRRAAVQLSRSFIAGTSPRAALPVLRRRWREGFRISVDLLGEAAVSEAEADVYRDRYLEAVDVLAAEQAAAAADGAPRLSLSVKPSSLYSRIGPVNHEDSLERLMERLRPIARAVMGAGGQLYLDMETASLKDLTIELFTGLLEEPEFAGWDQAGIALQAYLVSAEADVRRLAEWARSRRRHIHIRLVKGAYWESERAMAAQRGWPLPVYAVKSHSDASYERCLELLLAQHPHVSLAVASHNLRSIACALVAAERLQVPAGGYEFQVLYGMAEPVKRALLRLGQPVREYVPVGEPIAGMAYLVRRLLENTSNEGFLRRVAGRVPPEQLLKAPEAAAAPPREKLPEGLPPFANEPPLDFSLAANRSAFRQAIAAVRGRLGEIHPVVYGGREYRGGELLVSTNPADPDQVVCSTALLGADQVDRAVAAARAAQIGWGRRPPAERAAVLFRAAAVMRRRRFELAARVLLEVGKSWVEADADVCESIDFLEYYGREMLRLGSPWKLGDAPGEDNRYGYRPRGVGLVVAPWNFPLAISAGMVSAALVAGNAVLYKPSSLSPGCGWLVYEILSQAGLPAGVLSFLPGRGSAVGDALVEHPGTDFILFTGSLAVGLGIVQKAGATRPGQRGPKKVVIETGGKNAIIIDADADLDQAVPGVIQSAFGYQGQKCSACSRVIVLDPVYPWFLARLAEAVRELPVGNPEDPRFAVGPVIDGAARQRILGRIEQGRGEGRVLAEAEVPAGAGHYLPPTVLVDLPADSSLLQDEIFGPVLAVMRAADMDQAIALANSTVYGLTGGLYSRSPANIRKAVAEFAAGNLYVNRPITGALVGRQPFGGFRMSGVGSKAGGPDYLLQFMEPRVVTENTLRRGFTPEDVG